MDAKAHHKAPTITMTSSVRILTTYSLDSSPSVLLIAPNGDKTLINCGEGCQRSFLESPGLRLRTVTRVCLTHIGHDALGGLPGMVLTTADVMKPKDATMAGSGTTHQDDSTSNLVPAKRKEHPDGDDACGVDVCDSTPDLDVVGPTGTQTFLHSLRHFMRRDKFRMRVKEGQYFQKEGEDKPVGRSKTNSKRNRKRQEQATHAETFLVQTIPVRSSKAAGEVLSFVFTTPRVEGKFLPDRARKLGVPRGPLFAKLKSGQSVTFVDDTGHERTVHSHEVVEKAGPSLAIAVLYCPTEQDLVQLKGSVVLNDLLKRDCDSVVLDVVIHIVPKPVFCSQEYNEWRENFPGSTDHIWLETYRHLVDVGARMAAVKREASPFRASALGALTRSMINDDIYPSPVAANYKGLEENHEKLSRVVCGNPGMEYALMPRSKKGFVASSALVTDSRRTPSESEWRDVCDIVEGTGAREAARSLFNGQNHSGRITDCTGELVFTGTGSALPCKHRNVTGMYMKMANNNSLLLDVGEGTVGQLLRMKCDTMTHEQILHGIKAVWISHPHADHHLGLLRLLSERSSLSGPASDPLVLMAPPNLFRFLYEYGDVHPEIKDSYIPLDCQDMAPGKMSPLLKNKLSHDLGITSCVAVPVAHCPHSYAIVIDGTPFGRTAYSGDCRPSVQFADAGFDADLLIHEATFDDGLEKEAVLKRHCTVGEALEVSRRMRAKHVVLTHFSQRYPRIPPLHSAESPPSDELAVEQGHVPRVSFAFDFMRLTPSSLALSSRLTPALRRLYPADDTESPLPEDDDDDVGSKISAGEALSVPGLFARKELL